ncbi:transporter substrate-binding domain-containing protein [Aliiglaciecola sp. LCG003]|uniref:transporter substrate-binding domain-containing protein n=1 Tax=Aliiglaciecola sp. LCG003 TaxID=3053655 RepID=UPI0025722B38|nr:transporter substrate-binding domain-containing protein [Aliiglaciecola sp. LCG003]WJG07620.1 transporter substrate-binding domain-containing protein [Aliiglaciecola sp. LCG003]
MLSIIAKTIKIHVFTISAIIAVCISVDVFAADRTLYISSAFRAPYIEPPYDGLVWSRLKNIENGLDIQFKFVDVPAARSLVLANSAQIDGDVIRRYEIGEHYPDLIRVPQAVIEIEISVFSWDPDNIIHSFSDFNKMNEGIVATQIGRKFIEKNLSSIRNSMFVNDIEHIFSLLEKKRIDFVVLDRPTALAAMGSRFGDSLFEVSSKPLSKVKYYLYLHKKHADLVDLISAELERDYYIVDEMLSSAH